MLIITRKLDDERRRTRADVVVGTGLLAAAWLFAGWFGYTLLDPAADIQLRLTALGLAAVYHLGAYRLAGSGRLRWRGSLAA